MNIVFAFSLINTVYKKKSLLLDLDWLLALFICREFLKTREHVLTNFIINSISICPFGQRHGNRHPRYLASLKSYFFENSFILLLARKGKKIYQDSPNFRYIFQKRLSQGIMGVKNDSFSICIARKKDCFIKTKRKLFYDPKILHSPRKRFLFGLPMEKVFACILK